MAAARCSGSTKNVGVATRWVAPGRSAAIRTQRTAWVELLRLAPKGLRLDQPSVAVLRSRLTALASVVASALDAG